MPIPLTLAEASPLAGALRQAIGELRAAAPTVIIDADWLARHGAPFPDYPSFEAAFIVALRASVRKRFVDERKSDEFAVACGNRLLGYVILSFECLGSGIVIATVDP